MYFPLVLDGANGTELQKRGYDGSVCTEAWVLEHPDIMEQLQREYIAAGSDIVYAPTFGANRIKLEENGIFNQVGRFNRELAAISKKAAGGTALVAGDIATTGKFLEPLGDMTFEELYEVYLEQAEALEEAGVDMYAIETIMTVPDARAALLAVKSISDKPVLVSFTCDENGRTLTGTDVCAALVILQSMGADAFGLNCSTGPDEMLMQFRRLKEFAEVPLAVKPNAGLPESVDGRTVYNCSPDEFVKHTRDFSESGAAMFGGCCGTGPEHIKSVRESLDGFELRKPEPAHADSIVCATEKDVFVIDGEITAETVIDCGPELESDIKKANRSDEEVIVIRITGEADLDEFGMAQYAVRKPLCLMCEDAELLERALRLYQGRAIYSGEIGTDELAPLVRKYGLII